MWKKATERHRSGGFGHGITFRSCSATEQSCDLPYIIKHLWASAPLLTEENNNSHREKCFWEWVRLSGSPQQSLHHPTQPSFWSVSPRSCPQSGLLLLLWPLLILCCMACPRWASYFAILDSALSVLQPLSKTSCNLNFQLPPTPNVNFRPFCARIYTLSPLGNISHLTGLNQAQILF